MKLTRDITGFGFVHAGILGLFGLPRIACADPGDLDPSFGVSGRASFDPWPGLIDYSPASGAIALSDGGIVVIGSSGSPDPPYARSLFVARFGPDGSADLSFGNGGVINNTPLDQGNDVIRTADGQLVAAGSWLDDIALMRLDELGVADPAFGSGGIVQLDLGAKEAAVAVVEQPDGKLIVAADSIRRDRLENDSDIVVVRFEKDGSLDSSFGNGGKASITFQPDDSRIDKWETVSAIRLDQAGRLVLAGFRFHEHVENFAAANLVLARLTTDGRPDPAFGAKGIVELAHGTDTDSIEPHALEVLADGRLLVAGGVGGETGWGVLLPGDGFLARFMPDGTIDPSFGNGGIVTEDIGVNGDFDAMTVLADGSILAAGSTEMPVGTGAWPNDMTLTRFDPAGHIDDEFGEDGTALVDFGGFGFEPRSGSSDILVQPDGKVVVVGFHRGDGTRVAMARFDNDGPGFAGLVGFSAIERIVDAEASSFELSVRRTGGSSGEASVNFVTIDGASTAGIDYAPARGELHWEDGEMAAKTIMFTWLRSPSAGEAQFDVELITPPGGTALAARRVTITTEGLHRSDEPAGGPQPRTIPTSVAHDVGGGGSFGPLTLLLLALAPLQPAMAKPRRMS